MLIREGNVLEFADPRLNGEYSLEAFDLSLKLALSCTGHKQQRPSMEQVVSRLEKALEVYGWLRWISQIYLTGTPHTV